MDITDVDWGVFVDWELGPPPPTCNDLDELDVTVQGGGDIVVFWTFAEDGTWAVPTLDKRPNEEIRRLGSKNPPKNFRLRLK